MTRPQKKPASLHRRLTIHAFSGLFVFVTMTWPCVLHAQQKPGQNRGNTPQAHNEKLIEAVVATINQAVITRGQVEAEARVVLLRRGGLAGLQGPVDDGLRASVLQYLINQEVILAEAHRLQLFQVPQQDLDNKLGELIALFPDNKAYHDFLHNNGLSENDLKQILRRDLRVGRFLDGRVRMLSEIDLDELRAYYLQHQSEYPGLDFAQARERIAARLGRQRSAKAIANWVDELRNQARIRIVRPYLPDKHPADHNSTQ